VHGAASLMLVSTVMIHIYFAIRPEKRMYTRSMIKGWLTKKEFAEHHDARAWQIKDWQVKGP
jgi:cytochrome b subunit of formate dehydrogenase